MMVKKRTYGVLLVVCITLAILVGLVVYKETYKGVYPEIRQLKRRQYTFGELSVFFTKLAQEKGAVYAFGVLKQAPMPVNTDMHLLGHVIGDILYRQKGIEGITDCTQDFRNACSHSIVVGYFLKHGESGLPKIAETCRAAPGGSGAYTMCFHGLGHGILAAVDYDLPLAVSLCRKTGTPVYGFREASECVGGTIMEIISGGFHNKKLWEVASKKFLKTDDPLYPCDADIIPQASKEMCYEYITPHIVKVAGGSFDDGIPSEGIIRSSFEYCGKILQENEKSACYQGFGKEFVVLVHNRDTRTIDKMSKEEMRQVFGLCALAANPKGETDCLTHALDSLYWGGENDAKASVQFCSILESQELKDACFTHLINVMKYFVRQERQRIAFCREIPQEYTQQCAD